MTTKPKKRISVQSAKAKGRKLQQLVRDKIVEAFPLLSAESDVSSRSMGAGGSDVHLSTAAKKVFPYSVECKAGNYGRTIPKKPYDWIEQAAEHGEGEPLVVFRADRKEAQVIVSLTHFMELIQRANRT